MSRVFWKLVTRRNSWNLKKVAGTYISHFRITKKYYQQKKSSLSFVRSAMSLKGSSPQCPSSHKWAYNGGRYCCQYDKEKTAAKTTSFCDGGQISLISDCCKYDAWIKCPYVDGCVNAGNYKVMFSLHSRYKFIKAFASLLILMENNTRHKLFLVKNVTNFFLFFRKPYRLVCYYLCLLVNSHTI